MSPKDDSTTVEHSPLPEDQHNNDKATTSDTEEEDTKPTQPIKDKDTLDNPEKPMPIPTIVINNSEGGNVEPLPDSPTTPEETVQQEEHDQHTREEPVLHDEPDEIVDEEQHVDMDVKEQQQQDDSNEEHVEQQHQPTKEDHRHDKETEPISPAANNNTDIAMMDEPDVTKEHKPSQQPPSPPVEPESPDNEQSSSHIQAKDEKPSTSSPVESELIEQESPIPKEEQQPSTESQVTTGLSTIQQQQQQDDDDDDDETPLYQRRIQPPSPSVVDFYAGKTVLLTGSTGFVGKAVLWKLIQSLGSSIGKIYLLIRSGSNKRSKIGRPADRIKNEILNNKVK